jgi:hypothetical protein
LDRSLRRLRLTPLGFVERSATRAGPDGQSKAHGTQRDGEKWISFHSIKFSLRFALILSATMDVTF